MIERLARVEHRASTLEECLPRIGQLERGLATLDHRIERVAHDLVAIGSDSHRTVEALQRLQDQHQSLNHRISQLFWTGAGAMLAIGLLVSAINLLASVQELPLQYVPRQDRVEHPQPPMPQEPPPRDPALPPPDTRARSIDPRTEHEDTP